MNPRPGKSIRVFLFNFRREPSMILELGVPVLYMYELRIPKRSIEEYFEVYPLFTVFPGF